MSSLIACSWTFPSKVDQTSNLKFFVLYSVHTFAFVATERSTFFVAAFISSLHKNLPSSVFVDFFYNALLLEQKLARRSLLIMQRLQQKCIPITQITTIMVWQCDIHLFMFQKTSQKVNASHWVLSLSSGLNFIG